MKRTLSTLAIILMFCSSVINAQLIELTFTGKSNNSHVALDSVLIENLTQAGDTMLYYPDTVVILGTVGMDEKLSKNSFDVQNYPNPFNDRTRINIYMPEPGALDISIYNAMGKKVASYNNEQSMGYHDFTFIPGSENIYFLTAIYDTEVKTIKMMAISTDRKQTCSFRYNGQISNQANFNTLKSSKGFVYTFGDQLLFVGYASAGKDTIIDAPTADHDYTFEFTMGVPCPGVPPLVYGGQTYATVQIGVHCWMAENLNIGTRIDGAFDQTDNGILEKYCYEDSTSYCDVYGGLYQWDEIMEYDTVEGVQGICPPGWHIPTDIEWCILENVVDSDTILCDDIPWRGIDVGGNLKEADTSHWSSPNTGATNASGFTSLPGGIYNAVGGYYQYLKGTTVFWTSTIKSDDYNYGHSRGLYSIRADISSGFSWWWTGSSVRCILDCTPQPTPSNAGSDTLVMGLNNIGLMGNTPTSGSGMWIIVNGTGGSFADPTDPTTKFTGVIGKAYTLRWMISTICSFSYDDVVIHFGLIPQSCPGLPSFVYGGQTYTTILIGTQCWMAENLNIGERINGVDTSFNNGIIEKWCYNNDTNNCNIYGGLYQWNEMMQYDTNQGIQGICPAGWHLPTDTEWKILEGTVDSQFPVGHPNWETLGKRGFDVGGNLKETGTSHWYSPNTGATNLYDFTALPAGTKSTDFLYLGYMTDFASSTQYSATYSLIRGIYWDNQQSYRWWRGKIFGSSVRCLKD